MATNRLGKGLGALMADAAGDTKSSDGVLQADILLIDNNKDQPRKQFDEEKLNELAQSIKTHGIMQPVLVYSKNGRYVIVAGERRFRAAKIAGLKEIPVIVREFDDKEILELSLIENIQREDLNAMEQAAALKQLVTQYKMKQDQVADRVGKSRPAIANLMRLLSLPKKVQAMVEQDKISAGHARALLPLEEDKKIENAAGIVLQKGLSVRQTEAMIKAMLQPQKDRPQKSPAPVEIRTAEEGLMDAMGTKVKIHGSLKKGKIQIEYYTKEQLEELYEYLTR